MQDQNSPYKSEGHASVNSDTVVIIVSPDSDAEGRSKKEDMKGESRAADL